MSGLPEQTFTGVSVFDSGQGYVSSIADELAESVPDHGAICRWMNQGWAHRSYPFALAAICTQHEPAPLVLSIGVDGQVDLFTNPGGPGRASEQIDGSADGPSTRVPLRCARAVGNHVYAAGMRRRVYQRAGDDDWKPIDDGVRATGDVPEAVGFNDLDGRSDQDIVAVGYQGEIWRYDGASWTQDTSPVDVALTCVRVADDSTLYAAGLSGTLLRNTSGTWQRIEASTDIGNVWGMAIFDGDLYVATRRGVFKLNGEQLERVNITSEDISTMYLDAADGQLWSVGEKHLFMTTNGKDWKQIPVPS